jgi:hypothetical protein
VVEYLQLLWLSVAAHLLISSSRSSCVVTASSSSAFIITRGGRGLLRTHKTLLHWKSDDNNGNNNNSNSNNANWAWRALLISSFADGILPSPTARQFLHDGLVDALQQQKQQQEQEQQQDDRDSNQQQLRFLYIPTAMYAPRTDSDNSLGQQRQRARADGKKRRTGVLQLVKELLGNDDVLILAVTLDLDDGSIKQPEGSSDISLFPTTTTVAEWKPHLLYVEGGNTFWLHHCMTKGHWKDFLLHTTALQKCVYVGTSAGAILAGAHVETATWKRWDDPSVVPGMSSYDDWVAAEGLDVAGGASFFPHMSSEWDDLVESKRMGKVYCLADSDVCCIDGVKQELTVLRGPEESV